MMIMQISSRQYNLSLLIFTAGEKKKKTWLRVLSKNKSLTIKISEFKIVNPSTFREGVYIILVFHFLFIKQSSLPLKVM